MIRRWIFVTSCGLVIVTGFGGAAVLQGRMEIGELVAFLDSGAFSL